MLDRDDASRPERPSAIISRELSKYSIDITALSDVRFPDSGSLLEECGYTFYWSWRPSGLKQEAGVALAISNRLTPKLQQEIKPVNERIITLRPPLSNDHYCTMIADYEPTMTNSQETIDTFYSQLYQTLRTTPN